MKALQEQLSTLLCNQIATILNINIEPKQISFQSTRKEFKGDITLVCFPFAKALQTNPEEAAQKIGETLKQNTVLVNDFEVIKGFLNLSIHPNFWIRSALDAAFLKEIPATGKKIVVEYSSPNTNKPLHLGHIRNNLLGFSVANILKAAGNNVFSVQIINDRGIHICKSMLAWKKYGNGETPQSSGLKGDHLVGKYYVIFDQKYRQEIQTLIQEGYSEETAKKEAPLLKEAQNLLLLWEQNNPAVIDLWQTMNTWVYEGFEKTYTRLGVSFDKNYYESDTYKLGKNIVQEGLKKGVFYQKEDGSVWIDLTNEGLDHKLLLRSDGTSVYITQDLGTALERFKDFEMNGMIYTVGNEQDYHFKVLFLILKQLGYQWASSCYHLSYGMVDLPSGKMKSREGTVVDADDLMQDLFEASKERSLALGKVGNLSVETQHKLFENLAMGALKYFILKVDPKKRMVFNPEESIDLQGNTGPFIQYTHARIKSVLRKAGVAVENLEIQSSFIYNPLEEELELIKQLILYPEIVTAAAEVFSPAIVANYAYDLAHIYNKFYHNITILGEPTESIKHFRLILSSHTSILIKKCLNILGIQAPESM